MRLSFHRMWAAVAAMFGVGTPPTKSAYAGQGSAPAWTQPGHDVGEDFDQKYTGVSDMLRRFREAPSERSARRLDRLKVLHSRRANVRRQQIERRA